MFHPVGQQSPSVYWRRRLIIVALVVALIGLIAVTARVLLTKDPKTPVAAPPSISTSHAVTSPPASHSSTPAPSTSSVASSGSSSPAGSHTTAGAPGTSGSSAALLPCTGGDLTITALTSKATYTVGSEPQLMLQVLNKSTTPCTQNLADSQVVMRVYNGVSRVWGSHDCEIEPGTDVKTLAVGQPVQISLIWSGLSSQPKCAGTRQRVGAGTYTLYVSLSGNEGTAAQFALK